MPLYDESGNEVEGALAPDEVEIARQTAIEQFKIDNPQNTEIAELQTELAKKNEELKKFEDKDLNFKTLREAKEKAEKERDELTKSIDEKLKDVETRITEKFTGDYLDDKIKDLSGGDAELEKKIRFHYDRIKDIATTKEEISKKLADAVAIVSQSTGNRVLNGRIISSAGVGPIKPKFSGDLKPEVKELAHKLGISDADIQKHGNK